MKQKCRLRGFVGLVLSAVMTAAPLYAADLALVLGNQTYLDGTEPAAMNVADIRQNLRDAGFQVFGGEDQSIDEMRAATEVFAKVLTEPGLDRVLIVVSGRIVASDQGAWLLGRETVDLSARTVADQGLSLTLLDDMLATYPGQGILAIAPAWRNRRAPGPGLRVGIAGLEPGQGVTWLLGEGRAFSEVLPNIVTAPFSLAEQAKRLPDRMVLRGYLPRHTGFGRQVILSPAEQEEADWDFWHQTGVSGTRDDLEAYLLRYPDGAFAEDARQGLEALQEAAQVRAQFDWQQARALDTVAAYRTYLTKHPDSGYAPEAASRLEALLANE